MDNKETPFSGIEKIIIGGLILLFIVKGLERLWNWMQSPRHFALVVGPLILILIPVCRSL